MQTIKQFPNLSTEKYEKYEKSPNINQEPKIKYIANVSTVLNTNEGIINNSNKQVRKNIREKDVPVRKTKNINRS